MYTIGQPVNTPDGPGTVGFVRMAPPNYSQPEAVSVILNSKRNNPNYKGTMYSANVVTKATLAQFIFLPGGKQFQIEIDGHKSLPADLRSTAFLRLPDGRCFIGVTEYNANEWLHEGVYGFNNQSIDVTFVDRTTEK